MKKEGFTLIEIIVVLAIVSILAAVVIPLAVRNIEESRLTAAKKDVNSIATAIINFHTDVLVWPADSDGDLDCNDLWILGSDVGQAAPGSSWESWASGSHGDTFKNQLILNAINGNSAWNYDRQKWRGPYLSQDNGDPWGRRYYCNILVGYYGTGSYDYTTMMVISAGPDGQIQTPVGSTAGSRAIVELNPADIGTVIYGRQDW